MAPFPNLSSPRILFRKPGSTSESNCHIRPNMFFSDRLCSVNLISEIIAESSHMRENLSTFRLSK